MTGTSQLERDIASLSNEDLILLEDAINKRIEDARLSYKSYRDALGQVAEQHMRIVRSEKQKRGLTNE